MTAYELIHELKKLPEDCEVIIRDNFINWENTISDLNPISNVFYEDDTPIAYLYTE